MLSVPIEPALLATLKGPPGVTVPPSAIVSVPVPKLPKLSPRVLLKLEFAPVTITVPVEPTLNPMEPPPALFTVPPFWMISVPVPKPPTTTFPFVHVEPAPVTVTVPCEPGPLPMAPRPTRGPMLMLTVPPS